MGEGAGLVCEPALAAMRFARSPCRMCAGRHNYRPRDLEHRCCAMILADFGADVIKVEQPRKGDDARLRPPFLLRTASQMHRHGYERLPSFISWFALPTFSDAVPNGMSEGYSCASCGLSVFFRILLILFEPLI
jgi:hypothetical protein